MLSFFPASLSAAVVALAVACTSYDESGEPGAQDCTLQNACEAQTQPRLFVSLPREWPIIIEDAEPADASTAPRVVAILDGVTSPANPCANAIGSLPCSQAYYGDPMLTEMTLRVVQSNATLAEQIIPLTPFNYCGHDALYVVISQDAAGNVSFSSPRTISPCEEVL